MKIKSTLLVVVVTCMASVTRQKSIPDPKSPLDLPPPPITASQGRSLDINSPCQKPSTKCFSASNVTCLGLPLPYDSYSLDLTPFSTLLEVQRELSDYEVLRSVPKCWRGIQDLLCQVHFARCSGEGQNQTQVSRYSQQLCHVVMKSCQFYLELSNLSSWPSFLNCHNPDVFSPNCGSNRVRGSGEKKLNVTQGHCLHPLVPTNISHNYYSGVDGCGMRCRKPFHSHDDYKVVERLLGFVTILGSSAMIFVVITMIMAKWTRKYQSLGFDRRIVYFMGIDLFCVFLGFIPSGLGFKTSLTCESDGTQLHDPNLSCLFTAFFIYCGFIGLLIWLTVLAFCIMCTIQRGKNSAKGTSRHPNWIKEKEIYIQVAGWLIPLIAAFLICSLHLVESDPLIGVCFLQQTVLIRVIGSMLPLALIMIISLVVIIFSFYYKDYLKEKTAVITMIKYSLFYGVVFLVSIYLLWYQGYMMSNQSVWESSLRDYVKCQMSSHVSEVATECLINTKPNVKHNWFVLLSMLLISISILLLMCDEQTTTIWKFGIQGKKDEKENDNVYKGKKHEIIKKVYGQREKLQHESHMSLSLPHHFKAVEGLDQDNEASSEFNSSFVNSLARLMTRRGAIQADTTEELINGRINNCLTRQNSKTSFDSQMSIQSHELEQLRNMYDVKIRKKRLGKSNFFKSFSKKNRRRSRARLSFSSRASNSDSISVSGVSDNVSIGSFMSTDREAFQMRELRRSRSESSLGDKFSAFLDKIELGSMTSNMEHMKTFASVQTSTTDLSYIQTERSLPTQSIGTQYEMPKESQIRPLQPLEANVIRISIHNQTDEDSSIPSSFDPDLHTSTKHLLNKENMSSSSMSNGDDVISNQSAPPRRELHNRARRGGIVDGSGQGLLNKR